MRSRMAISACLVSFVLGGWTSVSEAQNSQFLEVRNALLDIYPAFPISRFNGPDRGGYDTLHGERAGHWWTGSPTWNNYKEIDIYVDPPVRWDPVPIPGWDESAPDPAPVIPSIPKVPQWDTSDQNLGDGTGGTIKNGSGDPLGFIVEGRFLVGAVLWPHEEFVEKFALNPDTYVIDDSKKVPIYYIAKYRLYIPPGYGEPGNPRNGKALIIHGNGGSSPEEIPPWLNSQLDSDTISIQPNKEATPNTTWAYHACLRTARRLGVPVMQLQTFPTLRNTWDKKDDANLPEGGISGYTEESRVDFPTAWVALADNADPARDHPQFMYAASYVRARTFLDGFFDPLLSDGEGYNTGRWSMWDEIVEEYYEDFPGDTAYYLEHADPPVPVINDVIIMGGSKRGHAVWVAGLADPTINAIISNGMAHLRIPQDVRLMQDELWEVRKVKVPADKSDDPDKEFNDPNDPWEPGDPDQLRLVSKMQNVVDNIGREYRRESDKLGPYWDIYEYFVNRDLMKYEGHDDNPLEPVHVYNVQGAQDPFWARMAWRYWVDDEIFHGDKIHGDDQHFSFDPFAVHQPWYAEFAEKMQGFCSHVWDFKDVSGTNYYRPMPTAEIWDIQEYVEPQHYEQGTMDFRPIRVRAIFTVPDTTNWPLRVYTPNVDPYDPENFRMRLCVGLRPVSATTSRGMWSDDKPLSGNNKAERSTPWWEIAPMTGAEYALEQIDAYPDGTSIPSDTLAYSAWFRFDSNLYYPGTESPPDFNSSIWEAGLEGVPPGYHVALYVRCAVEHADAVEGNALDDDKSWRVFASSPFEYLPPWEYIGGTLVGDQ